MNMSFVFKINKILSKYTYRVLYPILYKVFKNKRINLPTLNDSQEFLTNVRIHKLSNLNVVNSIESSNYNLTIIVPVYNVEKYIGECIESLLNQKTKYKYIIKIINDGSTDSSKQIIQSFINDPKIQFLEKQNGGLSSARNFGIKNIESDYVLFVDSDDVIKDNTVELLLDKAYSEELSIVEGNYYYFEGNKIISKMQRAGEKLYGFACNKVVKSSLLRNFQFEEGYVFEDTCMEFFVHELAGGKVGVVDEYTYGYRRNRKGLSFSASNNYASLDSILIVPQILDRMNYLNVPIDERVLETMLLQVVNSYNRYYYLNKNIQKKIFVYICNIFDEYFSECKYMSSKYINLYNSIIEKSFNLYYLAVKSGKY